MLDKRESQSKQDRGVVHVETKGYNQDGRLMCVFRRTVMVPRQSYLDARGGEQPARPVLTEMWGAAASRTGPSTPRR